MTNIIASLQREYSSIIAMRPIEYNNFSSQQPAIFLSNYFARHWLTNLAIDQPFLSIILFCSLMYLVPYSAKVWRWITLTNSTNDLWFIKVFPTNLFFSMFFLWNPQSICQSFGNQSFMCGQFVKVFFLIEVLHYTVLSCIFTWWPIKFGYSILLYPELFKNFEAHNYVVYSTANIRLLWVVAKVYT